MKNSGISGNENTLSSWLLESEEASSGDPSSESKKNALAWLGVESLPIENSTPTSPSPSQGNASTWLGVNPHEEKPATTNLNSTSFSRENALAWLGVELTQLPPEEKPTINISTSLPPEEKPTINISTSLPPEEKPTINISTSLPLEEKPTINISTSLPPEEIPQISISQPIPSEEKPPIRAENRTSSNFNQTIIQMFGGHPIRAVPSIQNQRNGQSILDFLGRGFEIQGPANHSQPLTSSHQKPSVNQRSFLDFMTNGFATPSSTIVTPRVTKPNKTQIIYC
jgi:hypothetical protein